MPELLVTLLIVGVLAAIAIPVYLGGRNSAADRAAQANLRNAAMAAGRGCGGSDAETAACLTAREPAFEFTTGPSTGPAHISFSSAPTPQAAVLSKSGTCWVVRAEGRQLRYGSGRVNDCAASQIQAESVSGESFAEASSIEITE